MRKIITALVLLMTVITTGAQNTKEMTQLKMTQEWDKVFPKSEKVEHEKISFHNHFGFEVAADVYTPRNAQGRLAAIAVCGPFGAVKEQSSGLYAQTLAERGFLTIAFDPSFTGESSGQPRDVFSLDINTEDFQAAVDYLSNRPDVDANRIGIVGICGWGCIALNAAANDPRIKATVASTMYDMPRVGAWGYFDKGTADDRYKAKEQIATLRTKEYTTGLQQRAGGCIPVDQLTGKEPDFVQQYSAYYKTKRGYHKRSVNSNGGWMLQAQTGWMNNNILAHPEDLRNAVLIVHGEKAHSRYMGEDTFKKLKGDNKQLIIVPGATHTDLYDQMDKIPFDRITEFLNKYLN
ncbi:MAG: alpha/beta hydrolase [Prevotella sp.]|nr:alpha/beta hydrolase [Prevotella sp.]